VRGEKHHRAKLSDEDVKLMRELRKRYGMTYAEIGRKFECSLWTVRDIVQHWTR
jgi:DNA-binding Lrp family transcriptional regulator